MFSLIQSRSSVRCERAKTGVPNRYRKRVSTPTSAVAGVEGWRRAGYRAASSMSSGRGHANIDRHEAVRLAQALDDQVESRNSVHPTQEITTSRIGNGRRVRGPSESCTEISRELDAFNGRHLLLRVQRPFPTALAERPASTRGYRLPKGRVGHDIYVHDTVGQ